MAFEEISPIFGGRSKFPCDWKLTSQPRKIETSSKKSHSDRAADKLTGLAETAFVDFVGKRKEERIFVCF